MSKQLVDLQLKVFLVADALKPTLPPSNAHAVHFSRQHRYTGRKWPDFCIGCNFFEAYKPRELKSHTHLPGPGG